MRTAPQQSDKGISDVSAQARKFQIVWQGQRTYLDWGNIRGNTHICGARRAAERRPPGRPTLGFLNPLLYKRSENAFKEVVHSANPGCGMPGFKATKG
ncbi:hypothetical protein B0H14DRAFT_3440013 [Mycena olivaceomarginata]|nr:hypothetical protein B0H14DRAFT_3440013 [Mycena olivaceomarginata]